MPTPQNRYGGGSAAPVSSNTYYNCSSGGCGGGGCFGETSTVLVGAGRVRKAVKDVRKGDQIVVADGFATVLCVAKIARSASKSLLKFPGGLTITKRHPVRINGEWTQPCKVTSVETSNTSGFVYNFVLDRCHIPLINGVECVTWGHGLTAEGVKHSYYGKDILRDLAAMEGYSTGFVTINQGYRTKRANFTQQPTANTIVA